MQTGTYKEVVTGIKMAIILRHHPDIKLDQTQTEFIQTKLLNTVDVNPLGEISPQFLYSKFAQWVFWITCANESTRDFLMRTFSGLGELWECAELTVFDSKDPQKDPAYLFAFPTSLTSIPSCHVSGNKILSLILRIGQSWFERSLRRSRRWPSLLTLTHIRFLARSNFKAFWGFGRIIFRTLKEVKEVKKHHENESSTSKYSPQ